MGIGWLNTALMFATGVIAITRWQGRRRFAAYALFVVFATSYNKMYGPTPGTHLAAELLGGLMCFWAVAESWSMETGRRAWWLWIPAVCSLAVPWLSIDLVLRYQLQREALIFTFLMLLPVAVKALGGPLLGWAVYGLLIGVSDAVKLSFPETAFHLLRHVDPYAFTAMCCVWLWALAAPERARARESLGGLLAGSPRLGVAWRERDGRWKWER